MYQRIDLSEKLIHFVRAVNRESDDFILSEMHSYEFGFGEIVETDELSPFFILRRILRKLQILSTWSYRSGRKTIHGEYPAVCFTDMPISAFVRSSIVRLSKGQKISNYAFVFDKKQMFELGARPVIYGRTKNEEFPSSEMYRFVSYDLSRIPYPIDWTHEREWRWANFDFVEKNIPAFDYSDEDFKISEEILDLMKQRDEERIDFHGLNLDKVRLSNVGVILKNQTQARKILRDVLWLIDLKKIHRRLITYILYFDDLQNNVGQLLEDQKINELISNGTLQVDPYYHINLGERASLIKKLEQLNSELKNTISPSAFQGWANGISFPCFNDNFNKPVRLLVGTPFVQITKLGRYLLKLDCLNQSQSYEINEDFVKDIVNPKLKEILGIDMTYYSVGSLTRKEISMIDINDVPFTTEPNDDEWNYGWQENDF